MAIVAGGQIKISDINAEKGLSPTAANSSLASLSSTGINPDSPSKPDGSVPHAMSEFYSYDHTYVLSTPTPTPSPTLCYSSTISVTTRQETAEAACSAFTGVTLYVSGPEVYSINDCSSLAQDGFYGDGEGNYYQISGGALTGPTSCTPPTPTPAPTAVAIQVYLVTTGFNDACAEIGDPYWTQSPLAPGNTLHNSFTLSSESRYTLSEGQTGYVYIEGSGEYWLLQNEGANNSVITFGPSPCPGPTATPAPTPTPSATPCYTSTLSVTTRQETAEAACMAFIGLTLYISGPEVYNTSRLYIIGTRWILW